MITNIEIEEFRCFKKVSVPMKPMTVLIGENDTGKSSFLRAVELALKNSTNPGLPVKSSDFHRGSKWLRVNLTIDHDRSITFHRNNPPSRKGPAHSTESGIEAIRYQLSFDGIDTGCDGYRKEEAQTLPLGQKGDRTAALLDHLLRSDRSRFLRIVERLKLLVPGFEDLNILTPEPSKREISITIDGGFEMNATDASAGVKLLLFFVTLANHPFPPDVVLFEEPENGIHPHRLREVVSLLRDVSTGKFGPKCSQVILTTHSPYLLDFIDPREDQVLVFQRGVNGERTVDAIDGAGISSFLKDFKLGEIWFNEQEDGLLGLKK